MGYDCIANINKSNHSVERQQCSSESNIKPYKRQSKKSRVKNCFQADDFEQAADTSYKMGNNSSEQHKPNNKTVMSTKVKSASWKRSENPVAPFNTLTNKKHKKSSNWLRFSNSKLKKSDVEQPCSRNESACRPGTTYSDVLFGAGCSNLVKVNNGVTPRFCNNQSSNVTQKKTTKSLFKFKGNPDYKIYEESEAEERKTLFPALQTIKNKLFPGSLKIASNNNNNNNAETVQLSSTNSQNKTEEAEVSILSDMEDLTLNENRTLIDNYLEHNLQNVDDDLKTTAANLVNDNKYLFDSITKIPKWNFICVETGTSDGFPKFLCQFEDETYLKAEKMALLGLKLAFGNRSTSKQ